jgi:hypothetical protein
LSEDLDPESVQIVVDLALGSLFPGICDEWFSLTQNIRETFVQERREKRVAVVRDIAGTKDALQGALRVAVVDHVISIFSYVLALNHNKIQFTMLFA